MKKILGSLLVFTCLFFAAGPSAHAQSASCAGFYTGQNVYETSTGDYKTARITILDCARSLARISFYGQWSGDYTVSLQSITPQQSLPINCAGFYTGQDVYETSTGDYKTARITVLDCARGVARISFYGQWSGDYTVSLQSIIPQQYSPVNCAGFYTGQNVYETSTGDYKTARITVLDCARGIARISFYGQWSGDYTVSLQSIIPQQYSPVNCAGFYTGQNIYETSTGDYKTARITILDCARRTARISFYGQWFGDYTVSFQNMIPQY